MTSKEPPKGPAKDPERVKGPSFPSAAETRVSLSTPGTYLRTWATVLGPYHWPMDLPSPTPICAARDRAGWRVSSPVSQTPPSPRPRPRLAWPQTLAGRPASQELLTVARTWPSPPQGPLLFKVHPSGPTLAPLGERTEGARRWVSTELCDELAETAGCLHRQCLRGGAPRGSLRGLQAAVHQRRADSTSAQADPRLSPQGRPRGPHPTTPHLSGGWSSSCPSCPGTPAGRWSSCLAASSAVSTSSLQETNTQVQFHQMQARNHHRYKALKTYVVPKLPEKLPKWKNRVPQDFKYTHANTSKQINTEMKNGSVI